MQCVHTNAHKCTHVHTHAHKRTQTHTCAHMRTQTHTNAHKCTHVHTHAKNLTTFSEACWMNDRELSPLIKKLTQSSRLSVQCAGLAPVYRIFRKWVVCAGMIFDNLCLASRYEFVPSTDCNSYWDDPVIRRHNQEARCATKPTRPVLCRRNSTTNSSSGMGEQNADSNDSDQTEFENFCYARIDGYLRSECDKKLDGGEA
jgi:hypothetical protein